MTNELATLRQLQPIDELAFIQMPDPYSIDDLLKTPVSRALQERAPSADNAFSDAIGSEVVGTGYIREGAVPNVRVVTLPDGTTVTPDVNIADLFFHRNTQGAGTLTVNKPIGNPKDGQKFVMRILSTNAQTFSWNPIFRGSAILALPTATSGSSEYDYVGFVFNEPDFAWDLLALITGI